MLIKRVVIQGFKTFAKRTEFIFDPGITAVVGPNGSGKSNIVDAVRWCLGEQSFSLLRSKKSADIIFSGSDKRARLGMAQVSLTLDNSGGEIPIDFAEVEITRRAYRDGDNEYLVNGQKVRLSDVSALLAQTGLGKRTYAVIGQGLIDRVLSLAPEERRSLFEEAAGITGYQSKRDVTLRRLEATQVNLTRVRDITAELAPRLSTLRRQAERAREREQMANDLRGLLRDWYGFQWHTAVAAVEENGADARILRNRMDDRQVDLEGAAAAIETLRTEQAAVRATLGEQHRAAAALHRAADEVGRALAVAQERQRQLTERGVELEAEVGALGLEHETLAARLAEARAALEGRRREVDARRAELAATEAALVARRRTLEQLRQGVESARRALALIQQRQSESAARRAQLAERIQSLAADDRTRVAALAAAQAEAESTAALLAAAEAEHATLEAEGARRSAALAELERTRTTLRTRLDAAEQGRRETDRESDRLQTRHDLLRRLSSEGQGMASGVRAVLQANLPGILGPVAALLRVRPEHDRAIETALGGALQHVVADGWGSAQAAIEFLKQRRAGRATFLPLDRLQTGSPIRAPRLEGVLGNAADLVDADTRAAAARDHLLNRTWIVTDLPTARRALDTLREAGLRPTVVTLEGEIVRPGGAVTGGSDGERRDDSVLARERELRALPAQIEAARTRSSAAAAACRELAQALAQAETDHEAQQRALADLVRAERSQRTALDDARRRSDRATQQLRYLAAQQASSETEAASFADRRRTLEEAMAALQSERTQAEAALAAAEAEAAREAADDLLRELADRRAAEAASLGDLNSRVALTAQQERTLAALAAQRHSKDDRRRALEAEAAALAGQIAELAAREGETQRALDARRAAIAPDEARLAVLAAEQAQAEAAERTLQHAQRQDESAWAHAQLALQRSEDAVHRLHAEIERDLGLVATESSDAVAVQQPLPLERFVEQLPVRESVPEGLAEEMAALRGRLGRLVNVNPDAPREYDEAAQRYEYLTTQADDLESAAADLHTIIAELDQVMQTELERTFRQVAVHFQQEFAKLFNGGAAELILTEPESIAQSGIEIIARPPGKRPQSLALLSGGERALAACALIFAILRVSPTPFCVLDEVDAALDEANVDRFRLAVEELSAGTQFIIVTHNRRTLEGANTIYGVTMGDDGISKVISLRLEGDRIVQRAPGDPRAAPDAPGAAPDAPGAAPDAPGAAPDGAAPPPERAESADLAALQETITL